MFRFIAYEALRQVKLKTLNSWVRVICVAVGLLCFLVFTAILRQERSYDAYNPKKERVFRLTMEDRQQGNTYGFFAGATKQLIDSSFPQIENVVRVLIFDRICKTKGGEPYNATVVIADPGLFSLMGWHMIGVNGDEALRYPDKVFLSRSEARKIFNEKNPIGEPLLVNNIRTYIVGGIFEDIPENSHLHFDYLISTESVKSSSYLTDFNYRATTFYVLLKDKRMRQATEQALTERLTSYFKVDSKMFLVKLQNLTDIYLRSRDIQQHSLFKSGNIQLVLFLPWIALLILLVVIGNYLILDIGRSISGIFRTGMHRAFGESRTVLFVKLYYENLIYVGSAAILAVLLLLLFHNKLSGFSNIDLKSISYFNYTNLILLLAVVLIIPAIPAGYSMKMANSISIADSIRCKKTSVIDLKIAGSRYSINLRRLMLGFQFFTAIFMITAALVAGKQVRFLYEMDLGFNRENVVVLENYQNGSRSPVQRYRLLKDITQGFPQITGFSSAGNVPLSPVSNVTQVRWPDQPVSDDIDVGFVGVDPGFFTQNGARIIEGRYFSPDLATDSISAVIVNRELANRLGGEVIGKSLIGFWDESEKTIIGVVDNIYYSSQNKAPDPMAFILNDLDFSDFLFIKTKSGSFSQTLSFLEGQWKQIEPAIPFKYDVLNDRYDRFCSKETLLKNLLMITSVISLILTLIGIISVAFMVSTAKLKEIGIRRVFGAGRMNLFRIFSTEFAIPFCVAVLLAVPFSYVVLNDWLTQFANKAAVSVDIFIEAILAIVVLLVTISLMATQRIASRNLSETLKHE